ncbi:transporter substrate-binding domain-containing protein [Vibrio salinus]|uniref:transporter substrate-binding domain-containing protein n=1 Tax=Vibrio salinus TaxID=2899784 RepID=UPI001E4F34C1|nr:transporter substrate-binding domain-containing protein [Vibrio salinus]MCE0492779.1 transporter substrate-binding domain-containing protein [Vibrio salinus]
MRKQKVACGLGKAILLLSGLLAFTANADVLSDIKAKGELVIGTEMQFAPFDFLKGNKHVGLNKDFFDEVGKELGVKVSYVDLPWPSVLPGLEADKFDMVAGPVTITKERVKRYSFTYPIADASVALLKKRGDSRISKPSDIAGMTIGVQKSSAQEQQLNDFSATLSKPVEVKSYVDFNQAYSEIMTGRVAAVANALPNIGYMASQHKNFEVVMPPFGKKTYFGYVVRKDEDSASLLKKIDDIMVKMEKDGRMKSIQKKWFGVEMSLPEETVVPVI